MQASQRDAHKHACTRPIVMCTNVHLKARFPLGDFFRAKRLSIVKIE